MDVTQALSLIEDKGSSLEKARARRILFGTTAPPDVEKRFAEIQNQDGGFPYNMAEGNLTCLNNTMTALWWLEELGLLVSPVVERAMLFIISSQMEDGGWDEDPMLQGYELPPWISPGVPHTRAYLTSYAAYWLGMTNNRTHPAFSRSLEYLVQRQDDNGKFSGYLHTTWISTSAMLMAGSQYEQASQKGIRCLLKRPIGEWESSQIAWAVNCLADARLPKDHPFIHYGLMELAERQGTDGGWSSEDGDDFIVDSTIGALKALNRFGFLTYGP